MNEQKTAVLMDSGGDLPYELCVEEGIYYLPLHVIYPEKDYQDGIDIDPLMIYRRFPDEIPTTSTPSPGEITEMFDRIREDGYEKVIAVAISSGLSGTGNTIRLAAQQYEGLEVYVFDTKNISFGSGIWALWAARQLRKGVEFRDLIRKMNEKIRDSSVMFYMDTLKYLEIGGRIGKVASMLGSVLRLKPIISCNDDGIYYTVAKIRGESNAKKKLLEEVVKRAAGRRCWVIIGDGGAKEEAEKMKQMLSERLQNMEFLFEKQITATLAINTGPGLIGVMTLLDP